MFPMSSFETLYRDLLVESDDVTSVGIFPGAFKPPHAGHYYTALRACENNQHVFIFASSKSRALSTHNKATGGTDCDSDRYANLLKPDSKFTTNMLSVQPAECSRMTSASAVRAALAIGDDGKDTVIKNLPEALDVDQKEYIWNVLMRSTDVSHEEFGHITESQMVEVWKIYVQSLKQESSNSNIHFEVSRGSPVRDTYDLVDNINNHDHQFDPGNTSIKLYVGT